LPNTNVSQRPTSRILDGSANDTFELFSKLPPDLRIIIWQYAQDTARVIKFTYTEFYNRRLDEYWLDYYTNADAWIAAYQRETLYSEDKYSLLSAGVVFAERLVGLPTSRKISNCHLLYNIHSFTFCGGVPSLLHVNHESRYEALKVKEWKRDLDTYANRRTFASEPLKVPFLRPDLDTVRVMFKRIDGSRLSAKEERSIEGEPAYPIAGFTNELITNGEFAILRKLARVQEAKNIAIDRELYNAFPRKGYLPHGMKVYLRHGKFHCGSPLWYLSHRMMHSCFKHAETLTILLKDSDHVYQNTPWSGGESRQRTSAWENEYPVLVHEKIWDKPEPLGEKDPGGEDINGEAGLQPRRTETDFFEVINNKKYADHVRGEFERLQEFEHLAGGPSNISRTLPLTVKVLSSN